MTYYQVLVPSIGAILGLGIVFLISLLVAPYRQRNEARMEVARLTQENSKRELMPLQDRDKLVRAIYEAKTTALKLIDVRSQLVKLYDQNPKNINEDKAYKVLKEAELNYDEAIRLLGCEKLVAGYEYEPVINSLMELIDLRVDLWKSLQSGLATVTPSLDETIKQTIEHLDEINQQAHKGGSEK